MINDQIKCQFHGIQVDFVVMLNVVMGINCDFAPSPHKALRIGGNTRWLYLGTCLHYVFLVSSRLLPFTLLGVPEHSN